VEPKKRGRPKKKDDMYAIWEHKYYVLSDKNNNRHLRNTVIDRIDKGYRHLFELAHETEPTQADVRVINRAVNDIIDRI